MNRICLSLLFLFSVGPLSLADTITFKDGTKLEGTIVKETVDSYTMMVQVTPSIKDERVVSKSTVASVDRSGPDDIAFKAIQDLAPAPDRLTADHYKERIGKCQAFLNVYGTSKHAATAKAMIIKLEAERKLAARGGLKLDGRWISAKDRATNAYEIAARLEIGDMKDDLEAGRYQAALRHFEKIEADFISSEKFSEARNLAQQALATYKPIVQGDHARVDTRIEKRAEEMQRLPLSHRKDEERAIAAQEVAYKKRVEDEKKSKTKWLTLDPYHKDEMRQVLSNIDTVLKTLGSPPRTNGKVAGPVYRKAWAAALAGNVEDGKKLVSELKSLKVPARYLAQLEAQLKPKAESTENKPTGTGPLPPPTTDTPPENDPPEKTPKKDPKEEKEPASDDSADPGDSPTPAADTEEKKGFPVQTLLVVVLVVVIVGALIAAFGGKKK